MPLPQGYGSTATSVIIRPNLTQVIRARVDLSDFIMLELRTKHATKIISPCESWNQYYFKTDRTFTIVQNYFSCAKIKILTWQIVLNLGSCYPSLHIMIYISKKIKIWKGFHGLFFKGRNEFVLPKTFKW